MSHRIPLLKSIWRDTKSRPGWLTEMSEALDLTPSEEALLCELDENYRTGMRALENLWRKDLPTRIADLRKEVTLDDPQWVRDCRRDYLEDRLKVLDAEAAQIKVEALKVAEIGMDTDLALLIDTLQKVEKRQAGVRVELRMLLTGRHNARGSLTEDEIKRAKDRPLDTILAEPPVKGFIPCPVHSQRAGQIDKHPSMLIKRGFGYCFSCGAHLDAIGYMMKVKGLAFPAAVRALQ